MRRLNYKHLQYFHAVAQCGSIQGAAERLRVTPQTISGQIKLLEDDIGDALFVREGRHLVLTEAGTLARDYCDDIFRLGDELQDNLKQGLATRPQTLRVGIVDALPKSIAHQLLAPLLSTHGPMRLICREEQMSTLLGELAVHRLDLVLADSPIPVGINIRCVSQPLGASALGCFATESLMSQFSGPFPQCLQGAPLLIPTDTSSSLRTNLLNWLSRQGIEPTIAGEFDDSALLKAFGSEGHGFFFAPEVITQEVCQRYRVVQAGTISELEQTFYAISAERKVMHSAVRTLTDPSQTPEIFNKKGSH
ncbi:MAG: transcriptional activator NhaR [Pseudomonadota bacterium]|nr:transcriptional activator NhaR [Pseudomonadota bacterium]